MKRDAALGLHRNSALGGRAGDNPKGREIGTVEVELTAEGRACPLFEGLPPRLTVQESHEQSVLELPPGATLLAHNERDGMQAYQAAPHTFGVQFHPEFDADCIHGYASHRADALRAEGLDPDAIAAAARDSDHGRRILQNFRALAERAADRRQLQT